MEMVNKYKNLHIGKDIMNTTKTFSSSMFVDKSFKPKYEVSKETINDESIDMIALNNQNNYNINKQTVDYNENNFVVGRNFVTSEDLLGYGSYGEVYLATDENGNKYAVKCCKMDDTGIANVMEASIMSSFIHPYLNRAYCIQATESQLYIIQKLALCDLACKTRRNKGRYKPSMDELKIWCHKIAEAVSALHTKNIIHADIKASNVLFYEDGSIKLTDFTLATKKYDNDEMFDHNVCTCTHRPLECFLIQHGYTWNESIDIWSLGCTFYELAYGELLFPYQGSLEPKSARDDPKFKHRVRKRSINALVYWALNGPNKTTPEELGFDDLPYKIDFISYEFCKEFYDPSMSLFNNLLCKMLDVTPTKRPTIHQVLMHPFFNGMKSPVHMFLVRPVRKLSLAEEARVCRYIQRYTNDITVQNMAIDIYSKCGPLDLTEHIKSAASVWLASKMVFGYPPDLVDLSKKQKNAILMGEREICHDLKFRLLS